MKPRFLTISGLNSFVEEQTIDFSKLIEKGLFGIFGPTGSGKSSILDAITIALYGHIARGTKEYINTETEKLYVNYEFEMGGAKGRRAYRVERGIKKNKNGGINTDFSRLSFLDHENNVVKVIDKVTEINDEITRIIGLNNNDFTRSVVLPQGKFSEFLQLSGSERRNMLERILGLEKYGGKLIDRIRRVKRKEEEKLGILNGELSRFEGVTRENIKNLKSELNEVLKEEVTLKTEIENLEKKYEVASKVWDLQNELNKYLDIKSQLDSKERYISIKKDKYLKGINAKNVKPYLDKYNHTLDDIKTNKKLLDEAVEEIRELKKAMDKTEREYGRASEDKEKEVPLLIEKESKVKQAIELERDVNRLKDEKKHLRDKHAKYGQQIEVLEKNLTNLMESKKQNINDMEEVEDHIDRLKLSPEYRELLNRGWEIEKEFNKLYEEKKELLNYINNKNKDILLSKNRLQKLVSDLAVKEKGFQELKKQLKELEDNRPKDKDYILKQELNIQELKMKLEDFVESKEKRKNLVEEKEALLNNRKECKIKIEYLRDNLNENRENLEKVKEELKLLEKSFRASLLSMSLKEGVPCPVCGSNEHPNIAKTMDEDTIYEIERIKEGLELRRNELSGEINKLLVEVERDERELNKVDCELNRYITKLEGINIEEFSKTIKEKVNELEGIRKDLNIWETKNKKAKEEFENIREEKTLLESKKIRVEENLKKDEERLEEENKKYKNIEEKLSKIATVYKKLKKELNIDKIENRINEVRKNDKKLVECEEKVKEIRRKIKELDSDRNKIEKSLNTIKIDKSRIEESIKEKGETISSYERKIHSLIGEKNPVDYLEEIKRNKTNILNLEEKLRKRKENEINEENRLKERKARIENTNNILEKSFNNAKEELDSIMDENGFKDIYGVNESLIEPEEIKSLEKEIKSYEEEVQKTSDNIDRLHKKLDGRSIEEEDWTKIKIDRKNKSESYNTILQEVGKKKEKINEMEKNYKRVQELESTIKKVAHRVDMLSDMFRLVSGNKFVEFAAIRHLKYIAREASKRLMDITNKRYSLELDSKGNFIICDNYNGGVRRDCNTLSGGETFMTSLSLALSLSTQIQLKGNASIEFFFLDEGFGTLDNQLLDTVMNSLERLHKEKLSVGIISHVEDLKSRVPIKLLVEPAKSGLHGTKVNIEKN